MLPLLRMTAYGQERTFDARAYTPKKQMSFLQQFLLSLTAVLGGGVVSAIAVSFLAIRKDRHDYRRKKAEELYDIIRIDGVRFFEFWNRYQAAFEGLIALNQAIRSVDAEAPERKAKAEMLVNMYLNSVRAKVDAYFESKRAFILEINTMSKSFEAGPPAMDSFHAARLSFEDAKQKLLDGIASAVS